MLQTVVRVCQILFLVLAIAALGWFLSDKFKFEKRRELTLFEQGLAERVVERVVEELPRREAVKRMLVMPVSGQELDGRVTDLLVERLQDREEYDIIDGRDFEDVRTPESADEAIKLALKVKDARPDGVLFSRVLRSIGHHGVGARVELESRLVQIDPAGRFPSDVVRKTEEIESRASLDWFAPYMGSTSRLLRLGLWLAITAGLPFAFMPLVQGVVRRENNRMNAAMLASFTAVNVLAALVLMGIRVGAFGWLLVLLAGLGGFVYNFVICDRIDEMRK